MNISQIAVFKDKSLKIAQALGQNISFVIQSIAAEVNFFELKITNSHIHTFDQLASGNAFLFVAEGLRFQSRAGQIGHSLTTAVTLLEKKLCCPDAMTQRWATPTRYKPRCNTASKIKDLILI